MSAAAARIDAEAVWASIERDDAAPLTLRRLDPGEALSAGTPFNPLIQVWLDRRTGQRPPDWDDFDFSSFRGWHRDLMVTVFPDATPDPEFRIIGEGWKLLHDSNTAGLRFSQCLPRLYDLQFRDHFQAIRDRGVIGWAAGRAPHVDREFVHFQALELPVRRGGDTVEGMIHAFHHQTGPDPL